MAMIPPAQKRRSRLGATVCSLAPLLALLSLGACAPKTPSTNSLLGDELPAQSENTTRSSEDRGPRPFMEPALQRDSEVLHHFMVGTLLLDQEDSERALHSLRRASDLSQTPTPCLHADLARLYLRNGDLPHALSESDKARQADPDDISNQLVYAGVLGALKRESDAIAEYEKILAAAPERLDTPILLASLLARFGQRERALGILQKSSAQNPKEAVLVAALARLSERGGDTSAARAGFERALQLEPQNSSYLIELVRLLMKENDLRRAAHLVEQAQKLDPASTLVAGLAKRVHQVQKEPKSLSAAELEPQEFSENDERFTLSLMLAERQQFDDAIRELCFILASDAKNDQVRYALGSLYAAEGRRKDAVEELLKIGPKQNMYVKSRNLAAFVLRQSGDLVGAEKAVRQALDVDPLNKNLASYLITILRDSHRYAEAEKVLLKLLRTYPDDDRLLLFLALVYHDLGRETDSRAVVEQAVALNPNNTEALNFLAYSLADNNVDLPRALELIQRALKLHPHEGYFLDTLGWIHFQRGEYEKAEKVLSEAVSLSADDIDILEHYGDVLAKLDKSSQALEAYGAALEKAHDHPDPANDAAVKRIEGKRDSLLKTIKKSASQPAESESRGL